MQNQSVRSASFLWDYKCSGVENTGVKLKADLQRNINVSVKNNIVGYGSYLFGVNISELGGANRFSYGAQLELNL